MMNLLNRTREGILSIKAFLDKHVILKKALKYILLFLCIWIAYAVLTPYNSKAHDNFQTIRSVMVLGCLAVIGYGAYLKGKGKLDSEHFATCALLIGFILRVGYAFYTGASSRQHDVEMYTYSNGEYVLDTEGNGHFAYAYIIYSTGKLPETCDWQFYHPPLWHATIALWMHIESLFLGTEDVAALYQSGMVVSSYVACVTLIYFYKILHRKLTNETARKLSLLLIALYPQFFIMSAWMNNEGMAFMFMIMSFYYGYAFLKEQKWKNIILCGLYLGLGAMSKVSVALICVPLAIFFIRVLVVYLQQYSAYKKKRFAYENKPKPHLGRLFGQYGAFLGVVIPLAFWFLIRQSMKFGILSIGVPGIDPTTSTMGVVSYSYWQRFGFFNPADLFQSTSCVLRPNDSGYMDYNVWIYLWKCSVLGEYTYWQGEFFIPILLSFNLLLALLIIASVIRVMIVEWRSKERFFNLVMLVTFLLAIVSYLYFQVLYPVTCTQDFRYMTLILLPGCYFVGKNLSSYPKNIPGNLFKYLSYFILYGFVITSAITYMSIR